MIIQTAFKIRRLKFWDNARANGCCQVLSEILTTTYRDMGYPARMIEGTFSPETYKSDVIGYYHCWVDLYDFIIDITVNQFDDIEEDVLIGPYEYYPQYYAEIPTINGNNMTMEVKGMREPKRIPWTEPKKGKSRIELREEFEKEIHRKHAMLGKIPSNIEPTTGYPKMDRRLIREFGPFRPKPIQTYIPSTFIIEENEIPYER